MLDSGIVEVAIGLIFVFSLLAILVTQINTFLGNILNWRAKTLKTGIQKLLTDKEVQAKLLAHPLVNVVKTNIHPATEITDDEAEHIISTEESDAEWIEPKIFVEALVDILSVEANKLYRPLQEAADSIPNSEHKSLIREMIRTLRTGFSEQTIRSLRDAFNAVEDLPSREKLLEGLDRVETSLENLDFLGDQLVPILEGVRKITDDSLRTALQTLLNTAQTVEEAQEKLTHWFNDNMGRASSIFRRRIQMVSIAVALALSVILNVDTLHLSRTLWEDENLRRAVANTAVEFEQSQAGISATDDESTNNTDIIDSPDGSDVTLQDLEDDVEDIGLTVQNLLELELPIGWEYIPVTDDMIRSSQVLGLPDPTKNSRNIWNLIPGNSSSWLAIWIQKIIGILATTIAAAQGAPFWFDLLNRIATRGSSKSD